MKHGSSRELLSAARGPFNAQIDDPFFNSTSQIIDANTNYMLSVG